MSLPNPNAEAIAQGIRDNLPDYLGIAPSTVKVKVEALRLPNIYVANITIASGERAGFEVDLPFLLRGPEMVPEVGRSLARNLAIELEGSSS